MGDTKMMTWGLWRWGAVGLLGLAVAGCAGGTLPGEACVAATVPFHLEGTRIYLDVSVNGRTPVPFNFDTGLDRTTLAAERAGELDLRVRDEAGRVQGIGDKAVPSRAAGIESLKLGADTLAVHTVGVLDFVNDVLDRGARPRSVGLIGAEVLSQCVVQVDYAKHVMSLTPPDKFAPPDNAIALPLIGLRGSKAVLPLVEARVNGVPGLFVVDTGADGGVYLLADFAAAHPPFPPTGKGLHEHYQGVTGAYVAVLIGKGESLSLGSASFAAPGVEAEDPGPGKPAVSNPVSRAGVAGLIGGDVLRHFAVTFDGKGQKIYLQPNDSGALSGALWGSGVVLVKTWPDAFEVLDVLADTPASRAPLAVGDRVVAINDRSSRELSSSDFGEIDDVPDGKPVRLTLANGRQVSLPVVLLLP